MIQGLGVRGPVTNYDQSELGKASVLFWVDTAANMKHLFDLMHAKMLSSIFNTVGGGILISAVL